MNFARKGSPGSKTAGALTVMADYYAAAQLLFDVSRGSFYPVPQVDSAVIRLSVRPVPAAAPADTAAFFRLVKAAFSQKRKTLANSFGRNYDKKKIQEAIELLDYPTTVRAEELSPAQFLEFYRVIVG